MQQLFPEARTALSDAELAELYAADARVATGSRPWTMVNMVASLDGATALDGVSGPLGGDGDRRVFRAIRSLPDVIIAARGTVAAENYGPPKANDETVAQRTARGQEATPRLAVVSGSLNLDPASRLFEDGHRPLLITSEAAPADRRASLGKIADLLVVESSPSGVDMAAALDALGDQGYGLALVEGGPTLNGELAANDLVDEWCISVAASIAGGTSKRIVAGPVVTPAQDLTLHRVLEHEGSLFVRYTRQP